MAVGWRHTDFRASECVTSATNTRSLGVSPQANELIYRGYPTNSVATPQHSPSLYRPLPPPPPNHLWCRWIVQWPATRPGGRRIREQGSAPCSRRFGASAAARGRMTVALYFDSSPHQRMMTSKSQHRRWKSTWSRRALPPFLSGHGGDAYSRYIAPPSSSFGFTIGIRSFGICSTPAAMTGEGVSGIVVCCGVCLLVHLPPERGEEKMSVGGGSEQHEENDVGTVSRRCG